MYSRKALRQYLPIIVTLLYAQKQNKRFTEKLDELGLREDDRHEELTQFNKTMRAEIKSGLGSILEESLALVPEGSSVTAVVKGKTGERGPKGPKGGIGEGKRGPLGPTGLAGSDGAPGKRGTTGGQGIKGETGEQGDPGKTGVKGETGPQGKNVDQKKADKKAKADAEAFRESIAAEFSNLARDLNNKITNDMQELRRSVNVAGGNQAGGGSVNLRDNDDVAFKQLHELEDGVVPVFNKTLNKFEFITVAGGGGGANNVVFDKNLDEVGTLLYVGEANPGSANNAASWRIQRIDETADPDLVIRWANGDSNFDKIWDNRATYSY